MRKIFSLLFLYFVLKLAGAEPMRFQSSSNQTQLLELYSSEGCSSCPPAEAWFSKLKSDPRLWKEFVPVIFHVDYWDDLGWSDPYGSADYSNRQRAYAARWKSESVYTPGFVLNGAEWRGWYKREELPRAPKGKTGQLTASSEDGKRWLLRFEQGGEGPRILDFHAALLGFNLTTSVKAGENRGRKLEHDFVVRKLARTASTKDGDSYEGSLAFDPGSRLVPHGLAVAVWVTAHNDLQPLQAVGGWLVP